MKKYTVEIKVYKAGFWNSIISFFKPWMCRHFYSDSEAIRLTTKFMDIIDDNITN
jgi:hypothetical protein